MVDIVTEAVINRPVATVAAFAMNPDNAPAWYVNIRAVEWQSPKPLRIGSSVAFVAQFLGRRLSYTYEIVELVPARLLRMRTAQGPFPMETTYEFDALTPETCRMKLRNRGKPSGFGVVLAPFVTGAMRRANRKDLARLKTLLEVSGR